MATHEPAEQYDGPATLRDGSDPVEVDVRLRGHFEPIDGRFHWYGRIARNDVLPQERSGSRVTIETPHGSADGRLSDVDPWGRFRVTGTGRPPF
ncbi:MAG: hypothetical protein JWR35_3390 [Marmoricola sp.]|nr:hypothetical protein [Marmoricola sp.]